MTLFSEAEMVQLSSLSPTEHETEQHSKELTSSADEKQLLDTPGALVLPKKRIIGTAKNRTAVPNNILKIVFALAKRNAVQHVDALVTCLHYLQ